MPQRFLKPGITNSQKWNACDWPTQSLYTRLITLVDDFGRYDANPKLLRGHAFALREEITADKVTEMCRELSLNGLAIFYQVIDKEYVQLTNWNEKPRADKSKFPTFDNTCKQMFTKVIKCSPPSSSSSPPSSPSTNAPDSAVAVTSEHQAFIKGWVDGYKEIQGIDYVFDAGRDGRAVREVLGLGILRIDLLEIAKKAWTQKPQDFAMKQALTIHGFRHYLNQIQQGLKNGTHLESRFKNPRNNNSNQGRAGDYAKIGKHHSVAVPDAGTPVA